MAEAYRSRTCLRVLSLTLVLKTKRYTGNETPPLFRMHAESSCGRYSSREILRIKFVRMRQAALIWVWFCPAEEGVGCRYEFWHESYGEMWLDTLISSSEVCMIVRRLLLFVSALLLATLLSSFVSAHHSMPEKVRRVCRSCHGLKPVCAKLETKSYAGWKLTVRNMVARGARLTTSNIEPVAKYLAGLERGDPSICK